MEIFQGNQSGRPPLPFSFFVDKLFQAMVDVRQSILSGKDYVHLSERSLYNSALLEQRVSPFT